MLVRPNGQGVNGKVEYSMVQCRGVRSIEKCGIVWYTGTVQGGQVNGLGGTETSVFLD